VLRADTFQPEFFRTLNLLAYKISSAIEESFATSCHDAIVINEFFMMGKMKIKKVIGFDSWTGGAVHFQRLLPALSAQSIQLTVVHISSWGNDPKCQKESKMDDLVLRDITFYGGDSFERMLDIEQPDAVIFLSTDTFAHRALIRYCKQRSIPTLNLYHGLRSVIDTEDEMGSPAVSPISYVQYIFSKMGKLLQHTFPCYIRALWKTKATFKDWSRFISDVFQFAIGRDPAFVRAADDARTNKCAVYAHADVAHAINCYGFKRDDVSVVGNPDFSQFGMKQSMVGQWSPSAAAKDVKRPIMYIETGFSSVGYFYSSTQEFIDHLIATSNSLNAQGYKMLLKLKPNQLNIKTIQAGLAGTQIELVTNQDFLQKLGECSACIAERTTLAVLPALMGMPLLLAKYGSLKLVAYGSVFTSYPKGYPLQEISDVSDILRKDAQVSDSDKLNQWIELNVGPLPPEKMPERVATIVNDMIVSR
jgi:hypothetical protein